MLEGLGPVVVVLEHTDAYQGELLAGIHSVLKARGVPILLHVWGSRDGRVPSSLTRRLPGENPCGLMLTPMFEATAHRKLLDLVTSMPQVPVVYLGQESPVPWGGSVRCDNAAGMVAVARHLVRDRAVRRVLVVRGIPHHIDSQEREEALLGELARLGVTVPPESIVDGEFQREVAFRAVAERLARDRAYQAIAALNDPSALGAIDAVEAIGLRVPDDVLVTGFDDDEFAAVARPALTTARQDLVQQGVLAAEQLLARIAGAPAQTLRTPVTLQVRESTGRAGERTGPDPHATASLLWHKFTALHTSVSLGRTLMSCVTIEELLAELVQSLRLVRVPRAFLVLRAEAESSDLGRLVLHCVDGVPQDVSGEQPFEADYLLPAHLHDQLSVGALAVHNLVCAREELGHLLLEQRAEIDRLAHTLRLDLSRAVQTIRITHRLTTHADELARQVAERTYQLEQEVAIRRRAEEQLRRLNSELQASLRRDGLTGIANRTAFDNTLARQWTAHGRSCQPLSLVMVDVDHFKAFNDRYGHLRGDQALRVVAGCLRQSLRRQDDLAARYGGEEFVMILPNTPGDGALVVAERVRELLAKAAIEHLDSPVGHRLTVSVGVATAYPGPLTEPDALIMAADAALYDVKNSGRDGVAAANAPLGSFDLTPDQDPNGPAPHCPAPTPPPPVRGVFCVLSRYKESPTNLH